MKMKMKKQERIDFIRRQLVDKHPANFQAKLNEYFESLDPGEDKFISYILTAGLTIEGILKPIARRNYIQICEELIDRIYDPEIYYEVIPKHIETASARRMIIDEARNLGLKTAKIFHANEEHIETINL